MTRSAVLACIALSAVALSSPAQVPPPPTINVNANAAASQPGIDAARSEASKPEETRREFRPGGGPRIQIQGDGIGLPQGVGTPAREKEKKNEAKEAANCTGPNREGAGCAEKSSDSVARRIDQGLERDPGATRPGDLKVRDTGVAVPKCFGESREGVNC